MTPAEQAEVVEAVGRLAAVLGRSLPDQNLQAAPYIAIDPEDVPMVAGLVETVRRLLDHVPGSLDAFAALLDPSMSAKRPCRT